MGRRAARPRPLRLAEKLLQIRKTLDLSQDGMVARLGLEEAIGRNRISSYETDFREPPLPVLLRYAEIANVFVDVLIDDRLDLPDKLPSHKKHQGIKRENNED